MPPNPDPDPTRDAALSLLRGVLNQHRPLETALDALTVPARDRAAAHRLAAGTLRRLGTLDAAIEPFLRRSPPPDVRHILRLGAAGLLFLQTPPHAAVGTAVGLAHANKLAPFAGLINAVLRKLAALGPQALEGLDSPRLDTPAWLWTAWGHEARAIAIAHQQEAPLDLTCHPGAPVPDGGLLLPTGTCRFPPGTAPTALPGFTEGNFWVQDAASALPARLLAAQPGEYVLDLCAAPGGKTAQLATTGARVTAIERDPMRLDRLRQNLARLNLTVETIEADALLWQPETRADAILLDAPCSATGTIRRHPDVPHLKRAKDIATLTTQQDALIAHAHTMLKPGGRLIYAVCSLQPEEGQARIATAVATGKWRADPFTVEEFQGFPALPTDAGHLRTLPLQLPEHGGLDGFFAARLVAI